MEPCECKNLTQSVRLVSRGDAAGIIRAIISSTKKSALTIAASLFFTMPVPGEIEAAGSYTAPNGLIRLDFYDAGESFSCKWLEDSSRLTSLYTLTGRQKKRLRFAADYWDGLVSHSSRDAAPAVFATVMHDEYNADALGGSEYIDDGDKKIAVTAGAKVLIYGERAGSSVSGSIAIGHDLFPASLPDDEYRTPIPKSSQFGLAPTMIHEIAHAMGITPEIDYTEDGVPVFPGTEHFYGRHLYDWRGTQAEPGMVIRTAGEAVRAARYFDLPGYWTNGDGSLTLPYFSGENVKDLLGGGKLRAYDTLGRPLNQYVPGIPVNGNEAETKDEGEDVDLGHLELRNGLMSHQQWRNYVSLMEAELAVLQDLGYAIDRRDYFGRSIYGDGLSIENDAPFFARDKEGRGYVRGKYNENPFGIGLHIYGDRNEVYQRADIMTRGTAGAGIRVDGTRNSVTVGHGVNVRADGLNGNGILVAFGKNHSVKIEQGGTVTALGTGGIGAAFDFGTNTVFLDTGARASYAARASSQLDPAIVGTDGPIAEDFVVNGTLAGKKAAIFISDNAFVKNINIGTGASVSGDIISEWKYDDDMIVTYTDSDHDGHMEGPFKDYAMRRMYTGTDELVTTLSFGGEGLRYDGDIKGADNMRLKVAGDLRYTGTAKALSLSVAEGGVLFGGKYDLVPGGVIDHTLSYTMNGTKRTLTGVGILTNRGVLAALSPSRPVTVTGDLVSDGLLVSQTDGRRTGGVSVSGTALIDGSVALVDGALPGETCEVLSASSVSGKVYNDASHPLPFTGMLSETADVGKTLITASALMSNNLETDDATINENYEAMARMYSSFDSDDPGRDEMRTLFSLSPAKAASALSSLSHTSTAKSMYISQRSPMIGHILSSRLMKASRDQDSDIWFGYAKKLGRPLGGGNYHGTWMMLGWDREAGSGWRAGTFLSHGKTGFSDGGEVNDIRDTRIGFYGGYRSGAHSGTLYMDFGRIGSHLKRGLTDLGLFAGARYSGHIAEFGAEYVYDLVTGEDDRWHFGPYANVQMSRLWQSGWREHGAGVFGRSVESRTSDYLSGGAGLEFRRHIGSGGFRMRLGTKRVFSGASPRLFYSYEGDPDSRYSLRYEAGKTLATLLLAGDAEFAPGWTAAGDIWMERGAHSRESVLSLRLSRMW